MGGRTLPIECRHGRVIDYGDFRHDDTCEIENCPECFPPCPDCDAERAAHELKRQEWRDRAALDAKRGDIWAHHFIRLIDGKL